ncbi:UNVERIFIED_CONTAM: hypothetical protein Sradi_4037200 [Sesamum radiatum]|uniref:Uncharacterized protein n=1 Tax=Sesamum radiatum TaxID=300843 RepID=A0AAW2PJI1_SESRA
MGRFAPPPARGIAASSSARGRSPSASSRQRCLELDEGRPSQPEATRLELDGGPRPSNRGRMPRAGGGCRARRLELERGRAPPSSRQRRLELGRDRTPQLEAGCLELEGGAAPPSSRRHASSWRGAAPSLELEAEGGASPLQLEALPRARGGPRPTGWRHCLHRWGGGGARPPLASSLLTPTTITPISTPYLKLSKKKKMRRE